MPACVFVSIKINNNEKPCSLFIFVPSLPLSLPPYLPTSLPFFNSLLALARAARQSGIMERAYEKVMTSTEPAGGRPAASSSQASATMTCRGRKGGREGGREGASGFVLLPFFYSSPQATKLLLYFSPSPSFPPSYLDEVTPARMPLHPLLRLRRQGGTQIQHHDLGKMIHILRKILQIGPSTYICVCQCRLGRAFANSS